MQILTASIITVIVFICFITEVIPVPVTAICGALLMGIFKVADFSVAFSGFSNDVVLIILGTSIVGAGLFETDVVKSIGNLLSGNVAKNEKTFIISLVLISALLSALLSNIAVTAMFIPVVASVASFTDDRISRKNSLMFLGISSGVGGMCTLIGSPPQLLANGMLKNAGFEGFKFFELGIVGFPLLALLIVYCLTIGHRLIQKCGNESAESKKHVVNTSDGEQNVPMAKKITAVVILVLMITGFCAQIWSIGAVSMAAGMLMIITRCISLDKVYRKVDWGSALTIAGSLGFASALEKSGVCQLIAQKTVSFLGGSTNVIVYTMILMLICLILTNVISNVACTTMFVPIALSLASITGLNPKTLVLAVVVGASMSWATPIASPPMVMVLDQGGYKFRDYLKVGGPFCLLSCVVAAAVLLLVVK